MSAKADSWITIIPIKRSDHIQVGVAAMPCVAPSDESLALVFSCRVKKKRRDQEVFFALITVVKEWRNRGVSLVVSPNAPIERNEVEHFTFLFMASKVGPPNIRPTLKPNIVAIVMGEGDDDFVFSVFVLAEEVQGGEAERDVLGSADIAVLSPLPRAKGGADDIQPSFDISVPISQ